MDQIDFRRFVNHKEQEWIHSLDLNSFFDSDLEETIENWLNAGNETIKLAKLTLFTKHRHDLFLQFITDMMEYPLIDDVSAGTALKDLSIPQTPDAYDPAKRLWADVSVSTTPQLSIQAKITSYRELLFNEWRKRRGNFDPTHPPTLNVFVFDVNTQNVMVASNYIDEEEEVFISIDPFIMEEVPDNLVNTMKVMSGLIIKHQGLFQEDFDFEEGESKAFCPDYPALPEVIEIDGAFENVLDEMIENASFDSELDVFLDQKEKIEKHIKDWTINMCHKIDKKELKPSPFKKVERDSIIAAFESIEKDLDKKYDLNHKAKPSAHGTPVLSGVLLKEETLDTKQYSIGKLYNDLFQEKKKGPLFSELIGLMNDRIVEVNKAIYILNDRYKGAALKPEEREKMKGMIKDPWGRGCLRYAAKSKLQKHMGVGKVDEHSDSIMESVNFANSEAFVGLKDEIRNKVLHDRGIIYNIHRDKAPNLESISGIYNRFLRSELFQEICCNAKMAENILISCAKPKKGGHLVHSGSENYFAIVGDTPGLLTQKSTVPLTYVSKNARPSNLWFRFSEKCGNWYISKADRLNKARLESLADSAHLASVLASIIFTTAKGTTEELLYAAGVFACVAVSVNIRDSGLLDHIRYIIPNIFSERSCAAEYISDKLGGSLKTELQGLIYQEIKTCVFDSMKKMRIDEEIVIEAGEILEGGSKQEITFLGVHFDNVFTLNGAVYAAYFACKKGLHVPELECKLMLETITKFEAKSKGMSLAEASTKKDHQHSYSGKEIAYGTFLSCMKDYDVDTWRKFFLQNDSFKECYKLKTFTSMRSSLKQNGIIDPVKDFQQKRAQAGEKMPNSKIRKPSGKEIDEIQRQKDLFKEFYSDDRTRVIDQFFDKGNTVWELAIECYNELLNPTQKNQGLFATWDLKRQRSDRDREIYILNVLYKCLAHIIEMTSKVMCDHNDYEQITSPGDTKTLNLKQESINFFKIIQETKDLNPKDEIEQLRATLDMTKWAPGDNLTKFMFLIAGLPYLKKKEKMMMMNFLAMMTRKNIILNKHTNKALANLSANRGIDVNKGTWAEVMPHTETKLGDKTIVDQFDSNLVPVRFSWLMGVLNYASSAVHAVSVYLVELVLKEYYNKYFVYYKPSVHSDDASADVVTFKTQFKRTLWEVYPEVLQECLSLCCIKISEKKSYLHKTRKEFVSELNMNGLNYSYWQKQALACITGFSYIDYYKDLADACSKINSLICLGAPPSVVNICLSNVIGLAKETYGLGKNQQNAPQKLTPDIPLNELPTELGGSIDMNPYLLPIVGLKYQNFQRMMRKILQICNVKHIEEITKEHEELLKNKPADLIGRAWVATAQLSAEEDINLNPFESSLITFRQFGTKEMIKRYRIYNLLFKYKDEELRQKIEDDPSLLLRAARNHEEKVTQLCALLRKKRYLNALAQNSPDQLKLDRILNRYNKTCQPSFGERLNKIEQDKNLVENVTMERGNMTYKEAYFDVLKKMSELKLDFYQLFLMCKSLPLFCYVYEIDQNVAFAKASGPKKLYAVRRYKAVTEEAVHTSPGVLLHIHFSGNNPYDSNVNFQYLQQDLNLIERYDELFKSLDPPERAVAINKMIQFPVSLSSLVYVPRPGWTGYKIIIGLIGNSFFDNHNAFPNQTVKPFKNETKYHPMKLQEHSLQQQLSDVAYVMKNIFKEDDICREYLQSVTIDGCSVEEILRQKENFRSSLYARILTDKRYSKHREPNEWELVYIKPQKKLQMRTVKWVGDFQIAMLCPEVQGMGYKRMVFFEGAEEMIHKVHYNGDISLYSDLKNIIEHFIRGMGWRGSIRSHLQYTITTVNESTSLYYKSFGDHSTIRITRLYRSNDLSIRMDFQDGHIFENQQGILKIEGVPFERLPTIMPSPIIWYKETTPNGLIQKVSFGVLTNEREINHYMKTEPNFKMDNHIHSFFKVKELIYDLWDCVKNRTKLDITYLNCIVDTLGVGPLDLDKNQIQDINLLYQHKWVSTERYHKLDRNRLQQYVQTVDHTFITWPFNPDQISFNMNLSSALITDARKARIYSFMGTKELKKNFAILSMSQMYHAIFSEPLSRFYKDKVEGKGIKLFLGEEQREIYENYLQSITVEKLNLLERQTFYKELDELLHQKNIETEEEKLNDYVFEMDGAKWADWAEEMDEAFEDTDDEVEIFSPTKQNFGFYTDREDEEKKENELKKKIALRYKTFEESRKDEKNIRDNSIILSSSSEVFSKSDEKSKSEESGSTIYEDSIAFAENLNKSELSSADSEEFERAKLMTRLKPASVSSKTSSSRSSSLKSEPLPKKKKKTDKEKKVEKDETNDYKTKKHDDKKADEEDVEILEEVRNMINLRPISVWFTQDFLPAGVIVNNQTYATSYTEEMVTVIATLNKKMNHNGNCGIQALSELLKIPIEVARTTLLLVNPVFNPSKNQTWHTDVHLMQAANLLDRDMIILSGNTVSANYLFEPSNNQILALATDGTFSDIINILISWNTVDDDSDIEF